MGLGDTFGFYNYTSDDTTVYMVKCSAAEATAGGLTAISGAPSEQDAWPYGRKNLRHVWGVTSAGKRTRLTCGLPANALYTGGGSFTLSGRTYNVEGAIGERRVLNAI